MIQFAQKNFRILINDIWGIGELWQKFDAHFFYNLGCYIRPIKSTLNHFKYQKIS